MSDWHTKKKIRKHGGQGMKARAFLSVPDPDKIYQGVPCKHGHSGFRYKSNGTCLECYGGKQRWTISTARPVIA